LNNREEIVNANRKKRLSSKIKELLIVGGLSLLIIVASWIIFNKEEPSSKQTTASSLSESERKVCDILEEIEGVGEAEVMICETQNGVEGVVVVCEGANDLQVIMNIREAVAVALGTRQSAVKIYLKKE